MGKSGVGSAVRHQEQMMTRCSLPLTESWKEASAVHINTVLPDSAAAAYIAGKQGKKVVCYGHSTMEDFRNSFIGSNQAAPLFKEWICRLYSMGDVILTPTEYAKRLLSGYGISKPIHVITNGVDTSFFHPDRKAGERFRQRFSIPRERKVVMSAGHLIRRKGIFTFLETAARMPDVRFIWFGGGNWWAVPGEVKRAMAQKPDNVLFPGYVEPDVLREAYCGTDAFAFFSWEETEGIVVLEALASGIPVVVRDIPVYEDWLQKDVHVRKASGEKEFSRELEGMLFGENSAMIRKGRELSEEHSIERAGMRLKKIYRLEGLD